jgi:N-acetylmuramoyl-L-alanine amidase
MKADDFLKLGKKYRLPVQSYKYNGKSIRTTIGIKNLAKAKAIQAWNESLKTSKIKSKLYTNGGSLWVPHFLKSCFEKYKKSKIIKSSNSQPNLAQCESTVGETVTNVLFGAKYKNVRITSNKLIGRVYYLVSGHGGPDPGAVGKRAGHILCEDEYAYDITLRLARQLTEKGATVYIIVRDKNDGIRDQAYLQCDKDEVCYPNLKIPINQKKRLKQRVNAINKLYNKHKKAGVKHQRVVVIHVDSRRSKDRVDMFFYYNKRSKVGKKLANGMYGTVKSKYAKYQKGRGYKGTVKPRNLHMLRESNPVGVYVELGNIQNVKDQKRFTLVDNRDAIASWFTEALSK